MFKRLSSLLIKLRILVQFLPLSFFSSYGFWLENTSNDRWLEAFQLAAVLAVFQLSYFYLNKIIMSRLVLSANTYLILGGSAAFFQQWWFLQLYAELQETAIFIIMLMLALLSTRFSKQGFIGIAHSDKTLVQRVSILLLFCVMVALIISITFPRTYSLFNGIPKINLRTKVRALG